jgi:uncharacterized protein YjbJ (UPF0337 family)
MTLRRRYELQARLTTYEPLGRWRIGLRNALGRYMNWDQIEGKWTQLTGSARERWGKLTDDDIQTLTGQKDHLVGKIQERYGIAKAEAEKQANAWLDALKET